MQPSFSSPFQPGQTSGAFSFNNFGQTQPGRRSFILNILIEVWAFFDDSDYNDVADVIGGGSGIFGQSNIGLSYV